MLECTASLTVWITNVYVVILLTVAYPKFLSVPTWWAEDSNACRVWLIGIWLYHLHVQELCQQAIMAQLALIYPVSMATKSIATPTTFPLNRRREVSWSGITCLTRHPNQQATTPQFYLFLVVTFVVTISFTVYGCGFWKQISWQPRTVLLYYWVLVAQPFLLLLWPCWQILLEKMW